MMLRLMHASSLSCYIGIAYGEAYYAVDLDCWRWVCGAHGLEDWVVRFGRTGKPGLGSVMATMMP